ncbi:MAG: histidine--tRNA ligase [Bacteroidia bacterium]|nr:histidine--tRNA ligase [Bacteroidia bacterium]
MLKKPKNKIRPALPSGFRDFGPAEVRRRRRVFSLLIDLFERFGYEPLETPAVELLSVLMGKYGDEGDKLLFRILNSGDFWVEVPPTARESSYTLLPYLTEKALRYDLTVPMARWVAQHAGELVFPFKRYQIQPVWRADRPQRGRFREFYQCDIDIVGAEGVMALGEILMIVRQGLYALGIQGATLHLNHRALLEAAATESGWPSERFSDFCARLDKIDKVGWDEVEGLFRREGYRLPDWLRPNERGFSVVRDKLRSLPALEAEVEAVQSLLDEEDPTLQVRWDTTLARGLEYYTGYVYEVRVPGSGIGSIGAGGAYASLVADFGGPDLPAMGFSFGIERILTLISPSEEGNGSSLPVLVAWVDASIRYTMQVVSLLHREGIPAFAYPSPRKLSKQLDYAQRRGLRWVVVVGAEEERTRTVQLKDFLHHTELTLPVDALASHCGR